MEEKKQEIYGSEKMVRLEDEKNEKIENKTDFMKTKQKTNETKYLNLMNETSKT